MKNTVTENNYDNLILKIFMFISPFVFGGFHIWVSAAYSVFLCAYIIYNAAERKSKMTINVGITFLSLLLIPLSYFAVSLWAVDSGTAVYGFVKFLPVALFGLIASGLNTDERKEVLGVVPYSAAAMGVISYLLSFIGQLSDYFLVASRLGGFFQYPNSFAVYCLVGLVILLANEKIKLQQWTLSALLTGLILLTGSRTVFVFLIVTVIIMLLKIQSANKIRLLAVLCGVLAVSVVIIVITDNMQTVGRFLTISLNSSTLQGRLLYYKDAIPVILKNPFGLGYYGYYFSQGAFQTGVYSVAYIHNEFLQLLLDIGWIPSLIFIFVIAVSLFSKKNPYLMKVIIFVIAGHSFFDFDLQFISVFLVLISALDFDCFRQYKFGLNKKIAVILSASLIIVSAYFALINSLFLLNKSEAVDKLYGNDTQTKVLLMSASDNYEEISEYADSIISENKYIAIAYDAKANYSYLDGDIKSMIEYKWKALDCAVYSIDEYNDFCEKLIPVIEAYRNMGDDVSADFCEDTLIEIKERLNQVEEKTSSFAWKIKDKPQLELLAEYEEYIARIER